MALVIRADVTDRAQVQVMAHQAETELRPVEILVSNAASFYCIGPSWKVDPEEW